MTRPSRLVLSGLLAFGMIAATLPAASAMVVGGCTFSPCTPGGGGGGGGGGGSDDGGAGRGEENRLEIACRVPALAGETASDDLRFTNIGSNPIPASRTIHWQMKQIPQGGVVTLSRPLLPGASIDVPDQLSEALAVNTRCLVRLG